jgi:hypothetical protein
MSLESLLSQGRLRRRETTRGEIQGLLRVVQRDLKDAAVPGLSADRCFLTAYEGALNLATVPLRCLGFETHGSGHHWTTFEILPLTMGEGLQDLAVYLESCRTKRNIGAYDRSGSISRSEAAELLKEARAFRETVVAWLRDNRPEFLD